MIKKAVLILVAGLMALEVFAQDPDTTSTVVGKKLNFEVPIFGISKRDMKPTWSVVTFDEVLLGLNYMLGVPGEIKPAGVFSEMSMLTLRYRPWRNGNIFSAGLLFGVDMNRLQKGSVFAENGSIIPVPATWERAKSYYSDYYIGIQMGYVREFEDWKAGVFVVPAYATTLMRNSYKVQDLPGIRHTLNMEANDRFQLGFKVGLWYHDVGISATYKPVLGKNAGPVPMYHSMQIGVSVRY